MSPKRLREILIEDLGFNWKLAAEALHIPYRTLQDYAAGIMGIPKPVADQVRAYAKEWKRYMKQSPRRIEADIAREFPNGF